MSKHASPAIIGAFVVAGLVLVLAGVLILGGGRYFRDTVQLITYFDGSVGGLRIGGPVKFRGIEIGTVKDIRINMTGLVANPQQLRIPVLLEIDKDRVSAQGVKHLDLGNRGDVEKLVKIGLRAELATESVVTGVRYIALDIKPETPARLSNDTRYPEIPSIRNTLEAIPDKVDVVLTNLAEVDFAELERSMRTAINHADELIGSPDLKRAIASLDELTATLREGVADVSRTARKLDPAIAALTTAAVSADKAIAPVGRLSNQVDTTLREVQVAARSLSLRSDQLSRDPGALLRGGKQ